MSGARATVPRVLTSDATHIVLYKKKVTGVKSLDGRVACKLTTDNFDRSEWWLLLEAAPES